jgi:hypothetical protein
LAAASVQASDGVALRLCGFRSGSALAALFYLLVWAGSATALELDVAGQRIGFSPFSLVAMSGEPLRIGMPDSVQSSRLLLNGQPVGRIDSAEWLLDAPTEPGLYTLRVLDLGTQQEVVLNLFVRVPADQVKDGRLNGYRIGTPPPGNTRHPNSYRAPAGFIEVTADNVDTALSPHFTLRQFLCKQAGDYPKYVAIQPSLLLLLEGLLQAVQEAGYAAQTFGVISGYRTPWYNQSIGNVANSRHVYGDAMDLFLDLDGDGNMDDMDADGDRDNDDVGILYTLAEQFMQRPENASLTGGIGRYGKTRRHGGFVHVDTRGYKARW